ncbi:MAG TPA: hypothetical protein VIM10_09895 [Actinopolymorphaceae bacterium]
MRTGRVRSRPLRRWRRSATAAAAHVRSNPAQVVISVLVAVLLALATWSAGLAADR